MLNLEKELDLISKELSIKNIDEIDHFARYVEMDEWGLVSRIGFEPMTPSLKGKCSTN